MSTHTCPYLLNMLIPPPHLTMPAVDTHTLVQTSLCLHASSTFVSTCPCLPTITYTSFYQCRFPPPIPVDSIRLVYIASFRVRKGPKVQKLTPGYCVPPRLAWVGLHRQQHSPDRSPAEGSSASTHTQQPHVPGSHCYIPAPLLPG